MRVKCLQVLLKDASRRRKEGSDSWHGKSAHHATLMVINAGSKGHEQDTRLQKRLDKGIETAAGVSLDLFNMASSPSPSPSPPFVS